MRSGELFAGRLPYSVMPPVVVAGVVLAVGMGVGLNADVDVDVGIDCGEVVPPPPAHAAKRYVSMLTRSTRMVVIIR